MTGTRRLALVVAPVGLVFSLSHAAQLTPTPQTGIGVWYAPGAPAIRDLWRPGDGGERLILRIRILDIEALPVPGAQIELWHADAAGMVHADRYRTSLVSGEDGDVEVSTVLPGYIWGPRHVHVVVTHPDHPQFISRIFFKRDPVVAESENPELAIFLEDGIVRDEPVLFGNVDLVLPSR